MNLQVSARIAARNSLLMTGKLQQAISLLQLSNLDLQSFIESQAEENPFVKLERPVTRRDYPGLPSAQGREYDDPTLRLADHPMSLEGHVSAQFDLMFTDAAERAIADRFLEALEANGWLGESLDVLAFDCGLSMDEAQDMLDQVQQVEPAGLFARNLAECLTLQAEDKGLMSPIFAAVLRNLPMLAKADLKGLCRVAGCTMDDIKPVLRQLRALNPKPGADFETGPLHQREPDLIVTKGETGWRVELNRSNMPTVLVDEDSAKAIRRDDVAREYVGERLGVARWLRRAVEHRNQTALAVAAEIVRRQQAFMDKGPAFIAPMTLAAVAKEIGVHESTVSRVTTDALMVTPQGTFNLKRFFSTALQTEDEGDEAQSAAAVRHRIASLVANEDPANPLSDDAIAKIVADGGPKLARRTVAKYRDMLKIPSSFQRRRQARLSQA